MNDTLIARIYGERHSADNILASYVSIFAIEAARGAKHVMIEQPIGDIKLMREIYNYYKDCFDKFPYNDVELASSLLKDPDSRYGGVTAQIMLAAAHGMTSHFVDSNLSVYDTYTRIDPLFKAYLEQHHGSSSPSLYTFNEQQLDNFLEQLPNQKLAELEQMLAGKTEGRPITKDVLKEVYMARLDGKQSVLRIRGDTTMANTMIERATHNGQTEPFFAIIGANHGLFIDESNPPKYLSEDLDGALRRLLGGDDKVEHVVLESKKGYARLSGDPPQDTPDKVLRFNGDLEDCVNCLKAAGVRADSEGAPVLKPREPDHGLSSTGETNDRRDRIEK